MRWLEAIILFLMARGKEHSHDLDRSPGLRSGTEGNFGVRDASITD